MSVQILLEGSVAHKPGAVLLNNYPGLVYAPQQHGDFVAFAHNGKPVDDVKSHTAMAFAISAILDMARDLGVSFGDVCDALKYLRDCGKI